MIVRHIILFVLLVVLPYFWVDYFYWRIQRQPAWRRVLWWLPSLFVLGFTAAMARVHDFIPQERVWIDFYILLLGLLVIPVAFFCISSAIGWLCHSFKRCSLWADKVGIILGLIAAGLYVYSFTAGFNKVETKYLELSFKNLPVEFDGCRIVHVSDLHVGTYGGWRKPVLEAIVDSIKKQNADYVFFTGDLQNTRPREIEKVKDVLNRLPHVYSILGNHDHSAYAGRSAEDKKQVEEGLRAAEQQLGWALLVNSAVVLRKTPESKDSILLVGLDNDGEPPFPSLADYSIAPLQGRTSFTILLQHDPSAWRRNILQKTTAELTLSGHTHGGQFGWGDVRLTKLRTNEDKGLYQEGGRYLYVNSGAGALMPVRLGIPNEITVITLRKR